MLVIQSQNKNTGCVVETALWNWRTLMRHTNDELTYIGYEPLKSTETFIQVAQDGLFEDDQVKILFVERDYEWPHRKEVR